MKRIILLIPIILLCGCSKTETAKTVAVFPFISNFSIDVTDLKGKIEYSNENNMTVTVCEYENEYVISFENDKVFISLGDKVYDLTDETIFFNSHIAKIKNILAEANGKDIENGKYKSVFNGSEYTVTVDTSGKPTAFYTDEFNVYFDWFSLTKCFL